MFGLILAPLLAGVCLHSSLAETEPHVFIIARQAESRGTASLVILGAVDSVSRLEPPGSKMVEVVVDVDMRMLRRPERPPGDQL